MIGDYISVVKYLTEQNALKPGKTWEVKEHKQRRSLDSNAYFHVLADKLRQKMTPPLSMAEVKNHLITSYGQIEYQNGKAVYIKTNIPTAEMAKIEYLHCEAVKFAEDAIFYRVYRGSHTYNSSEMAQLIAGTIDECQALGIETATPAELARMSALWEKKHDNRL